MKSGAILVFVLVMKRIALFNILCKGQIIHSGLTHEESADIFLDLAEDFYQGKSKTGPEDYEIREVNSNGNA